MSLKITHHCVIKNQSTVNLKKKWKIFSSQSEAYNLGDSLSKSPENCSAYKMSKHSYIRFQDKRLKIHQNNTFTFTQFRFAQTRQVVSHCDPLYD